MLRESQTAVVARNETWSGAVATEPYEAGWASEAVIFVRALEDAEGAPGEARVEISPDGMRWVAEGTSLPPADPRRRGDLRPRRAFRQLAAGRRRPARRRRPDVLVTFHLKAEPDPRRGGRRALRGAAVP